MLATLDPLGAGSVWCRDPPGGGMNRCYTGGVLRRALPRLAVPRWQAAVAVFLTAVGFLVVAQLRARAPIRQAATLPTWRLQELAVMVRTQEEARRLLQAEVDALRRRALEYEAAVVEGRGLSEAMARELASHRLVLGLVPVEGPGVRVVVAGGPTGPTGVLPAVVEAQDLSGLINELWSAGAEAMAVNGTRILATTGIRQARAGFLVGGTPVSAPYRIEAIGDAAPLQAALAIRGGFVEGLRAVGIRVAVQPEARLRLPARSSADPFRYARPKASE